MVRAESDDPVANAAHRALLHQARAAVYDLRSGQCLAARGEAAKRMPPVVSAIKAGVKVGAGTDAHRVASYNPFVVLQWLLDGRTVSGREQRVADEIPTREQALRLYTQGSAWFAFDEQRRGTLEPGKLADFALLDQDITTVPVDRIGRTSSLLTVVGGQVVHTAAPFTNIKP